MKYYSYDEPNEDGSNNHVILSEKDILERYYDFWYGEMVKKYGKEYVDNNYNKKDCIEDFLVIHWAQEEK